MSDILSNSISGHLRDVVDAVQDFTEPRPKDKTGTDCQIIIATANQASLKTSVKSCLGEKSAHVGEQVSKFSRDVHCRAVQV